MQNFFELFNLDESFDLDLEDLDLRYFELQAKYHPDRSNDPIMGLLVNDGYNILKDNFKRANHILELHEIFVTNDKLAPKLSSQKLEQILEEIEEGQNNISELLEEITYLFKIKDYEKAALKVLELRFLEKGSAEQKL